jgi:Flp pilus assembly protein TadG
MSGKDFQLKNFFKYQNNNKGVAMTMFLVLTFIIIPLMGLSMDLSRVWHDSYRLEMATRYAGFTGATELVRARDAGNINPSNSAKSKAEANFRINFPRAQHSVVVVAGNGGYVRVNGSVRVNQYFMPIFGGDPTVTLRKQQQIQVSG